MQRPIKLSVEAMANNAEQAERLLKMLANSKRLMILCHLIDGEKSVGQLVDLVGLSQSALSQHLMKMREQQLVSSKKEGLMVYYSLHDENVKAILNTLYSLYCA